MRVAPAIAVLAVVLAVIATFVVGRQSANAGSGGPILVASDNFSRTVHNGWGTADLGGSWTIGGPVAKSFAVAKGVGTITLRTDGQGPAAWLRSVASDKTDISVTLGSNKAPAGSGTYLYVVGRNVAGAGNYLAKVRLKAGGSVGVTLERRSSAGAETALGPEQQVPGLVFDPAHPVRVHLQVSGTGPTTLRARVWRAGSAETTSWNVTAQDSTKDLQRAGDVGISAYLSRSAKNAPLVVSVDDLTVWSTVGSMTTPRPKVTTSAPTPTPTPTTASPQPPADPPIDTGSAHRATASAGAAAIGSTRYPIPSGAIFVSPNGNDGAIGSVAAPVATVARAAAMAPAGGTIVLRGGTYHESVTIAGSKALTLQSYPGEAVWFDGASSVAGWVPDGNAWRVNDWTAIFDHSPTYTAGAPDNTAAGWNFVNPSHPMAAYPDQVWIDGSALTQVGSRSQVAQGTFYVDASSHQLFVGSNPIGHGVSASTLSTAFTVTAPNTVLRGFGVRRYATSMPMMGTVRVFAPGVTLENIIVSDNATQGITINGANATLRHVSALRNGLLGIHANYADRLRIISSIASNNNTQNFNMAPVSGGIKITQSRTVLVTDSVLASNRGPGVWLDMSVYNTTFTGNDFLSNAGNGLVGEISDTMVVANNLFEGNGGNGVKLDNTGNVQIWNNTFTRNNRDLNITQDPRDQFNLSDAGHDKRQKLPDPTVPWLSANIAAHNNIFDNSTGNALLAVEDYTHRYSAAALRITVNNNVYLRASTSAPTWAVIWSRGAGDPAVYTSLASFKSATGQERQSIAQDGVLASHTLTTSQASDIAAPLPGSIASLIAQPSGIQHLGAWG